MVNNDLDTYCKIVEEMIVQFHGFRRKSASQLVEGLRTAGVRNSQIIMETPPYVAAAELVLSENGNNHKAINFIEKNSYKHKSLVNKMTKNKRDLDAHLREIEYNLVKFHRWTLKNARIRVSKYYANIMLFDRFGQQLALHESAYNAAADIALPRNSMATDFINANFEEHRKEARAIKERVVSEPVRYYF